jgi:hypothetical protein
VTGVLRSSAPNGRPCEGFSVDLPTELGGNVDEGLDVSDESGGFGCKYGQKGQNSEGWA